MDVRNRTVTTDVNSNSTTDNSHSTGNSVASRRSLVLWNSPFTTLYNFLLECLYRFSQFHFLIARNKKLFYTTLLVCCTLIVLDRFGGPHTHVLRRIKDTSCWWLWWIWLGFLSSCGFGTGLHTFVLYLGPFIAEVTMSAYECNSLNFPQPPYPSRIICQENGNVEIVTFWRIAKKVQIESIMWGFGTALGELPPYFMAQGARLSGQHEEELQELEDIISSDTSADNNNLGFYKRAELMLHRLIMRAGFIGILLCASIPNPLFDLAGMTCGHFLVPFWSFFGATFIGKALIKVHIQQFFVIAISSEHHIDLLVSLIGRIPIYGRRLQAPLLEFLNIQKAKLHNKTTPSGQSWLQTIIFFIVLTMICSFLVSIVHAFANRYDRRLREWQTMADKQVQSDSEKPLVHTDCADKTL